MSAGPPSPIQTAAQADALCGVFARLNNNGMGDPGSLDQFNKVYTSSGGGLLNPKGTSNGNSAAAPFAALSYVNSVAADYNSCKSFLGF